jgi:hypothetical protein
MLKGANPYPSLPLTLPLLGKRPGLRGEGGRAVSVDGVGGVAEAGALRLRGLTVAVAAGEGAERMGDGGDEAVEGA